jgi:hypothetical protein
MSRIRRLRTFALATALSAVVALLTVGAALADGGTGSWPR